jgi:carbonic anhydrase/acetyltransferase-like protein (isoleucine patch superfamily)
MIYKLGNREVQINGKDYFIAENAIVIGSVILENNVSIWFNTVVRADFDIISIGENSNIQDGSILHTDPGNKLTIGQNVTIGHKVTLHGCEIGDFSLIGMDSVILNGAKIGKYCLLGANTLITEGQEIPDGSVVMGSPGKIVKEITEETKLMLEFSAQIYVDSFKQYNKDLVEDEIIK